MEFRSHARLSTEHFRQSLVSSSLKITLHNWLRFITCSFLWAQRSSLRRCKQNGGYLLIIYYYNVWISGWIASCSRPDVKMSSIESTLDALTSVDSLVDTLKACIWKQDKVIREKNEEIENLKSRVKELEKERNQLHRYIARERANSLTNVNTGAKNIADGENRWGNQRETRYVINSKQVAFPLRSSNTSWKISFIFTHGLRGNYCIFP